MASLVGRASLGGSSLLDLGLTALRVARPPSILVLGDADFAYTLALDAALRDCALAHPPVLSTSAYETEDELVQRYPHAPEAMATLAQRGVSVRCGVDARTIASHYGQSRFDRIVFNLPQSPPAPKARNQIQRHRALLRDFCGSAAGALAPRGELWITLLSGQGGTPLDPVSRVSGDTWQLQEQAAAAGLLVTGVASADLEALAAAGYHATGRRKEGLSLGMARKSKGLVVHVLAPEGSPLSSAQKIDGGSSSQLEAGGSSISSGSLGAGAPPAATSNRPTVTPSDDTMAIPSDDTTAIPSDEGVAAIGIAPLEHTLDNSFWIDGPDDAPSLSALLDTASAALDPAEAHTLADEPTLVDAYQRPEDGRRARTYRFVYRSQHLALGRDRALALNAKVCEALAAALGGEHRNPVAHAAAMAHAEADGGGEGLKRPHEEDPA